MILVLEALLFEQVCQIFCTRNILHIVLEAFLSQNIRIRLRISKTVYVRACFVYYVLQRKKNCLVKLANHITSQIMTLLPGK